MLEKCVRHELETLQEISRITAKEIKDEIGCDIFLPEWTTSLEYDFKKMYQNRMENLFTLGYGIYANNIMFNYNKGEIVPAKYPDSIRLSSHIGYERQQKRILDNTYAFLKEYRIKDIENLDILAERYAMER